MTVQGISKIEGGCAAIYCWSFSWVLRMFWLVKHIESFSKPIPCIAADEYFSRDETWYCRLESTASPAASWPFSGSDLWISALPERTGVSGNTWNRCLLRILIAGVWPDKQRSLFTTQSINQDWQPVQTGVSPPNDQRDSRTQFRIMHAVNLHENPSFTDHWNLIHWFDNKHFPPVK